MRIFSIFIQLTTVFFVGFYLLATAQEPLPDSYSGDVIYETEPENGSWNITVKSGPPPISPSGPPPKSEQTLIHEANDFIEEESERISVQSIDTGEEITEAFHLNLNYFFSEDPHADWALHLDFSTEAIESRIHSLFNDSILVESQEEDWGKYGWNWFERRWSSVQVETIKEHWTPEQVEYLIQDHTLKAEYHLQTKAFQEVNRYFNQSWQGVQNNVEDLQTVVRQSYPVLEAPHAPLKEVQQTSLSEYYDEHVTQIAQKVLESQYSPHELALIQKPKEVSLKDVPYKFKSPEGAFLQKNQALYLKLYEARPHHEQGKNARILALSALEVADEESSLGDESTGTLAYQVGEAGADIALDVTPYVGFGKDVYEALTGRHLLTGRSLTHFERTMSVMGIALSTVSGGAISSGTLKTAFSATSKTLGKIHQKAWEKGGLFAHRSFEAVVDSSHRLLDSLQRAGFHTKKGIKSAGYFLKRAFGQDSAGMEELARTINIVQRSGIENWTHSLEELSSSGIVLPKEGEEFLARQLRFGQKLGLENIDQAHLVRTGKVYAEFFENMDEVQPAVVEGTVWRALRKRGAREGQLFSNNPENLFKPVPGAKYTNRRYSLPGEEALYTSLSRKTALKEVKVKPKGLNLTDQRVEELYHIGSKDIEVDQVLDLTNKNTRELFKVGKNTLTEKDIATEVTRNKTEYEIPQIIGHIAKRRGFKGIKAPSAPDKGGQNLILFKELK